MKNHWKCYIVRCSDGSLYTGITTDIKRRIYEHNHTKKGSKYCRSRRPVKLLDFISDLTKNEALEIELHIKSLKKNKKLDQFEMIKEATNYQKENN